MRIEPTQEEADPKLADPDVFDRPLIILMDGLHHQFHEDGRLTPQLLKVDVGTVAR